MTQPRYKALGQCSGCGAMTGQRVHFNTILCDACADQRKAERKAARPLQRKAADWQQERRKA